MKVSKEDVFHVAQLAKISLDEEELSRYQVYLEKILDSIDELREVDTEDVKEFFNHFRELNVTSECLSERVQYQKDKVQSSLPQKSILKNSPDVQYAQFKITNIVELE